MIKFKKILFLLFILQACSYEPILTKRNYDFNFGAINTSGDSTINKTIKDKLISRTSGNNKFDLLLKSKKNREIVSSDTKGDPEIYSLIIIVEYFVSKGGKDIYQNKIIKQTTYNNLSDKYELSQYEEGIIKNLSDILSNEILFSVKTINE